MVPGGAGFETAGLRVGQVLLAVDGVSLRGGGWSAVVGDTVPGMAHQAVARLIAEHYQERWGSSGVM